jgi:phosphoribosyl 1,2-cyclic phosphodiesterase
VSGPRKNGAGGQKFTVRFWGVRGSVAAPGPDTVRYGGNTSCVEIWCGERRIVIDAGTGIRMLGRQMISDGPTEFDLLLSHTHLDHIEGLPFFPPAFAPGNVIRIWAGHLLPRITIEQALGQLMSAPLFPVPLDAFSNQAKYCDFRAGDALVLGPEILVKTTMLDHPNHAVGYRIEYDGRSICYISDTTHVPGQTNENIAGLIHGADLVIYDSMFTDPEFAARPDWGHSTWREGARLAKLAGVKKLVLFHHEPSRTDEELDELGREAARHLPGTIVAQEGATLDI